MITQERLKEILHYDPETGIFTWKVDVGRYGRIKAGSEAGYLNRNYYECFIDGIRYPAHRLAWFYVHSTWPELLIDHINGNGHDNRICNLREATKSQNACNQKLSTCNSSGIKGLFWSSYHDAWCAHITKNGIRHSKYSKDRDICETWLTKMRTTIHSNFSNDG